MTLFDDNKPIRKVAHEIGSDLSAISVDELKARVALLKSEIERIEKEISAKASSKNAAQSLFKS